MSEVCPSCAAIDSYTRWVDDISFHSHMKDHVRKYCLECGNIKYKPKEKEQHPPNVLPQTAFESLFGYESEEEREE